MGFIEAICISSKKGVVKKQVSKTKLIQGWGLEDDAHGGDWHRQVSLLPGESIDKMREMIPGLAHGAFAENIVTRYIDLGEVEIGSMISLNNEVVLEITQIGKTCHTSCKIKTITGDCIMPREGIFAKVIHGGTIEVGQEAELFSKETIVAD